MSVSEIRQHLNRTELWMLDKQQQLFRLWRLFQAEAASSRVIGQQLQSVFREEASIRVAEQWNSKRCDWTNRWGPARSLSTRLSAWPLSPFSPPETQQPDWSCKTGHPLPLFCSKAPSGPLLSLRVKDAASDLKSHSPTTSVLSSLSASRGLHSDLSAHPLLGKCALTPGPLHLPAPLSGTVFPLLSPEFTILDLYSDLSSSLWWVYLKFYFSLTPSSSWKCESESPSVVSNSLQPHGPYSPWNSLVQRTGVGSRSLPQGIFPTQGSNPGLSHCRQILYQLSHKGSPFCF